MNKKEQKQLEDALTLAAMHPTAKVEPDVPPPINGSGIDKLSVGFLPLGVDHPRVEPACSSSCFHGVGSQTKTTSQRPVALYSTEILAWKAARNRVEEKCMDDLRRIDRIIENLTVKTL